MNNIFKLTIISVNGGLNNYPIGTKVELQKEPTNKRDTLAIKALVSGKQIGYVSASSTTTLRDCLNNREFYPYMKNDTIEAKVIATPFRTALIVEVKIQNYNVSKVGDNAKSRRKKILTLKDVKNEIVQKGICTLEELNEVENYLDQNGVFRSEIIAVFKSYKKYDEERTARIPKKPQTLFKDYFGAVKKNVIYINRGKNLRFIGEKGTGKNNLITTLAWIYKRPLYEVSLNSQFDKTDLLGTKTIITKDVNEIEEITVPEKSGFSGQFKSFVGLIRNVANTFLKRTTSVAFDKEAFVEAMEVGGIINLDEVNTADPSVLVLLHSVADRRRSLQVPGYGRVVADDNFTIILTMNKGYQGTVSLNEATRDRFVPILFPENTSIEYLLQSKYPNADADYIRCCDQLYKGILGLIKDGELSMDCLTIRGFEDAIEVANKLGLREALIDNVANRVDDEEYSKHIINMIDDIIDW